MGPDAPGDSSPWSVKGYLSNHDLSPTDPGSEPLPSFRDVTTTDPGLHPDRGIVVTSGLGFGQGLSVGCRLPLGWVEGGSRDPSVRDPETSVPSPGVERRNGDVGA